MRRSLVAAAWLMTVGLRAPVAQAGTGGPQPDLAREEYRYEARPAAHPTRGEPTRVILAIDHAPGDTRLSLVTTSRDSTEEIRMAIAPPHSFQRATRRIRKREALVQHDEVWRDGERVWMESRRGDNVARKSVSLPDLPFAVDASLLLFGRSFVESDLTEQRVFMADFSRHSITILLRKRGLEVVTVPAGTFACHKLEVVVRFLIFKAVITYWVSAEPPHFLVKHVGRRSPFARTTVTQLVERSPAWPQARLPEF